MAATSLTPARSLAQSRTSSWALAVVETQQPFGDGATIPFFRFQAMPGTGSRGDLPFLDATEGTMVSLSITNQLAVAIEPGIKGLGRMITIAPGTSRTVTFPMPPAGSYLLQELRYDQVSGPLGMAAVVVSRPVSGNQFLWNGGPSFDREYILHYQDSDDRWNQDAAALNPPNTALYEPNYFTVNGLSYPDSDADPDTHISCQLGERILLRLSNSGNMRQAIHFHGYHVSIAARNNTPNTILPEKDTVEIKPGGTTDVILKVNQTGLFPVHPHSLTAVTSNGLYPYGQLTLIEAI